MDSAFWSVTFKMPTKNIFLNAYSYLKVHLHSSNIKVINKSQNSRNQGSFFCLLMVKDPDPLWIRLRIQQAQKHTNPDPDADPDLADSEVFTGLWCTLVQAVFIFAGACCSRCNWIPFGTV
jgi:hypothetical protein